MSITEQFFSNIDWLATIKDFIIILLSIIALMSTYFQNKKNIRRQWINDFRSCVAKMIGTISKSQLDDNIILHEPFEHFTLVTLYINHDDKLHIRMINELQLLKESFTDLKDKKGNVDKVSKAMTTVMLTAKEIINKEEKKIF